MAFLACALFETVVGKLCCYLQSELVLAVGKLKEACFVQGAFQAVVEVLLGLGDFHKTPWRQGFRQPVPRAKASLNFKSQQ